MKMISLAICVLINCICIIAPAQSVDVAFYPGMKSTDPPLAKYKDAYYSFEMDMQGISGFSANLKRSMHNIFLKKYDATMTETTKIKVGSLDKEYGPLPPTVRVVNDKLFLFFFKMNEKNLITMYAAGVDPTTLQIAQPAELMTIDEDKRYLEFYMRSVSFDNPNLYIYKSNFASSPTLLFKSFFIETSPAGDKHLVAWSSGWNNKLFYSVFDNDLKKIRTGAETLPDESSLSFSNACIDNNGNAYFLYSYSKKNKPAAEILVNKKGGVSEIKSIAIPEGQPFGAYAAIDKANNKLLICGAYKEETDYLAGVYFLSLNSSNMTLGTVTKTPFPNDLVELFDKEGWGNKKEKKFGLSDGLMLEATILENGVMNLTGEFRRTVTGTRSSFMVAGSILNARFNGNTAVFSRIPKVRVSAGSTFGDSYRVFGHKNSLIIFYNDHLSNLKLDFSETPTRSDVYKNSVMATAIIDNNGAVKRETVIDMSEEDYLASVESIQKIVSGNFFVVLKRIKSKGGVTSDIKWASLLVK